MPPPHVLVLATTNPGKADEFQTLLAPLIGLRRVRLVLPADLGVVVPPVEETGTTFRENARLKASAFAAATGHPALADDSGLCVDAIGGAPGIHSARWAGPDASDADRVRRLLRALQDIPDPGRTAHFICALAVATPDGIVHDADGVCHGRITHAPRGEGGFGYDPVFLLPDAGRTMAELSREQKDRVSHRALALNSLAPLLLTIAAPGA